MTFIRATGAFGALHAALTAAETDWAVIMACDLPLVSPGLLHRLSGLYVEDFDAIVPVQPDGRLAASLCPLPCRSVPGVHKQRFRSEPRHPCDRGDLRPGANQSRGI